MPRNGSGTFTLAQPAFVNGAVADATAVNSDLTDIASGLTLSFPRDGQAPPTANLPMGNFKLTGLGAGTTAGDSVAVGQTLANLTTTGNTTLGAGTTDTLNVGGGGLIKDAVGNVTVGTTSTTGGGALTIVRASSVPGDVQVVATVNTLASVAMGYNNSGSVNGYGAPSGAGYFGCAQNFALTFGTNATNRLAIDTSGNTIPGNNNVYTLGSTGARWSTLYAVNGNFSGNVGINGKTPVASATAPTAAGATYTTTEQALLNDIRTKLIAFGIYT